VPFTRSTIGAGGHQSAQLSKTCASYSVRFIPTRKPMENSKMKLHNKCFFIASLFLITSSIFAQSQTPSSSENIAETALTDAQTSNSFFFRRPTEYEVTITNLTYNQVFSPSLVVSHRPNIRLFKVGEAASEGIAIMAEAGDVSAIVASVDGDRRVRGAGVTEGPLLPGQSTTITIPANGGSRVSLVSMLVNTNDAFYAVNSAVAPRARRSRTLYPIAYDAGSEINDEFCSNIPGPACGGVGSSAADGEGFIHVHRGLHGIGDLSAAVYDWRNPVAKVIVRAR